MRRQKVITMAKNNLLDLKELKDAKLCSEGCKHVNGNGLVENMKSDHVVYCVGCGRKCHMPCHQVPEAIVNAVKSIPINNRAKAYFGELSYMRIVCDNCANLLICDVQSGAKPTFLTLFNSMTAKLIEKLGEVSDDKMDDDVVEIDDGLLNPTKKRRAKSLDTKQDMLCELIEMKSLLNKCFIKMNNVEDGNNKIKAAIENKGVKLNEAGGNQMGKIERSVSEMVERMEENSKSLASLHTMVDKSRANIDDGFQKGFNKLVDLTQQMNTPATPANNDRWYTPDGYARGSSMRRVSFSNQVRHYRYNTPTSSFKPGPSIPTETGAAKDESFFGPAVPRRINFNTGEHTQAEGAARREFCHEDAIYIRYVDASITADKMLSILQRNESIKRELDQNPDAVEITRLVKKRWSEEEIAQRRFGISYRIGCNQNLLSMLNDKSMWANHWEIRKWDNEYGKNEEHGHRFENPNFRHPLRQQNHT